MMDEHLTKIEEFWAYLFTLGNPLLILTAISFFHHEIFYFGRFIPFMICDYVPALRKYKIQSAKDNSMWDYWVCTKALMFSHFVVQLPMMIGFHPVAEFFGMQVEQVPFPPLYVLFKVLLFSTLCARLLTPNSLFPRNNRWKIAAQVCVFFVFEDFYHYWMHRALHHGIWYKKIHKVHHEYQAPFGLVAEYAHPLETMILGVGTIGGPILYVMATGDLHIVTVLVWIAARLIQTIDAHSGYDFPWSLHNLLPFWGGSDHHDYHHYAFVGNYSSSFRWWDTWFGTDSGYEKWKAKKLLAKGSGFGDKQKSAIIPSGVPVTAQGVALSTASLKLD